MLSGKRQCKRTAADSRCRSRTNTSTKTSQTGEPQNGTGRRTSMVYGCSSGAKGRACSSANGSGKCIHESSGFRAHCARDSRPRRNAAPQHANAESPSPPPPPSPRPRTSSPASSAPPRVRLTPARGPAAAARLRARVCSANARRSAVRSAGGDTTKTTPSSKLARQWPEPQADSENWPHTCRDACRPVGLPVCLSVGYLADWLELAVAHLDSRCVSQRRPPRTPRPRECPCICARHGVVTDRDRGAQWFTQSHRATDIVCQLRPVC